MNFEDKVIELIIVTLLYGVNPFYALSEKGVLIIAEKISQVNPRLPMFLLR